MQDPTVVQPQEVANCALEGCSLPALARGYCRRHYRRLLNSGVPGPVGYIKEPQQGPCSVPDCTRPATVRGLCRRHYERKRLSGDPGSADIPPRAPRGVHKICTIDGCGRKHVAFGLCATHRRRLLERGELGGPIAVPPPASVCSVEPCGLETHARGLCRHHYDAARKTQAAAREP